MLSRFLNRSSTRAYTVIALDVLGSINSDRLRVIHNYRLDPPARRKSYPLTIDVWILHFVEGTVGLLLLGLCEDSQFSAGVSCDWFKNVKGINRPTPLKTNMDTTNDALENASSFQTWPFLVSIREISGMYIFSPVFPTIRHPSFSSNVEGLHVWQFWRDFVWHEQQPKGGDQILKLLGVGDPNTWDELSHGWPWEMISSDIWQPMKSGFMTDKHIKNRKGLLRVGW